MMRNKSKHNQHGGPRKGAGRKPITTGGTRKQVTLDQSTIDQAMALGDGNLSEGIRRAVAKLHEPAQM